MKINGKVYVRFSELGALLGLPDDVADKVRETLEALAAAVGNGRVRG